MKPYAKTLIAFSIVLPLLASPALAREELKLFGVRLANATKGEMRAAIVAAGGKMLQTQGDIDKYDCSAMALPAVEGLEVVYLGDRLVMAQYVVGYPNETLRNMLKSKYGMPIGSSENKALVSGDFTGETATDGKYTWTFPSNMAVIYNQPMAEGITLTYLNRSEQAKLGKIIKANSQKEADQKVKAKSELF